MIMDIRNRLLLLSILPSEGTLSEMVDIYDLARELKLSDEEKAEVSYIENNNYVKWDFDKDPNKEIKISGDQMKIVKETIDKLDKQGKIKLEMIPLIKEWLI